MVKNKYLSIAKSSVFTMAAIGAAASAMLNIIMWIMPDSGRDILDFLMVSSFDNNIFASAVAGILSFIDEFRDGMQILGIITAIPAVVSALGLLMFVSSVRKDSTSGIGAIKAGVIINIAYLGIVEFCAIFACVGASSHMGKMSMFGGSLYEDAIVSMIMVLCIILVAMLYQIAMVSTVNVAATAIKQNKICKKPSLFVVVVNIVFGILGIINSASIFLTAASKNIITGTIMFMAISGMLGAIAMLLFGIVIVKARSVDNMAVDVETTVEGTRFCKNCGKTLYGSEVCSCMTMEIPTITPVSDTPMASRFCIYCGKVLHGDEVCSCSDTTGSATEPSKAKLSVTPVSTPTPTPASVETDYSVSAVTKIDESSSPRLISTMGAKKKTLSEEEKRVIEEGKSFFSKADDLD